MYVVIPRVLLSVARRLLRTQLRRSAMLPLGPYQTASRFTRAYQDYRRSAGLTLSPGPHNWNRLRLPVYGSFATAIPVAYLELPDNVQFVWENPSILPWMLPEISLQRPRRDYQHHYGVRTPKLEVVYSQAPPHARGRKPPPGNRRRRDAKPKPGFETYSKFLSFTNRTISRPSEYGDFATAIWHSGGDPFQAAANLSFNEFIDHSYGARARFLKNEVYSQEWYRLPFGLDTATRLLPFGG